MARGLFPTNNYLSYTGGVILSTPLTMACWVYSVDKTSHQGIAALQKNDGAAAYLDGYRLRITTSTGTVNAEVEAGTSTLRSSTTAGAVSTGAWNHIGGVFESTTSRIAYLAGVAATAQTSSCTPGNATLTTIGAAFNQNNTQTSAATSIYVAELGFWNIALTVADMLQLAAGYSPIFVKPENLVSYYPLIRGDGSANEPDLMARATMAQTGAVNVYPHSPVRYFFRNRTEWKTAAPPAGLLMAIAQDYYRQLRG